MNREITNNYNQVVTDLLMEKPKEGYIYLTLYIPYNNQLKSSYKVRVKSYINGLFDKKKELSKYKNIKNKIIEKVQKEIQQSSRLGSGIAIFYRFKPDLLDKEKSKIRKEDFKFVVLSKSPKKEGVLAEYYDLDQIIWIDNTKIDTLVLNFSLGKCEIYSIKGENIKKIDDVESDYAILKNKKEGFEVFSPLKLAEGKNKAVFSTTKNKTLKRKRAEYIKTFINKISKILKDDYSLEDYKYLIIFHSKYSSEYINDLKGDIDFYSSLTILSKQINIRGQRRIKKEATSKIRKFQNQVKTDLLNLAKEKPDFYAEGWNEVTKASRNRNIDSLFIKPNIKKSGYLYQNRFLYSYPARDTRLISNMIPYLISDVVTHGGKLYIFNNIGKDIDVSAKLRF